MRSSEYLVLKWSDIDWQRGAASVSSTIQVSGSALGTVGFANWTRSTEESNIHLTHNWGGEALIAGHMALLQAIETCALALNATPNPTIDVLKEDFHVIWGAEPPNVAQAAEKGGPNDKQAHSYSETR
jgi:hypothetical protein